VSEITAPELLRLAEIAAAACGWAREDAVALISDCDPPAVCILDHACRGFRDSRDEVAWYVGDDSYEDVKEALAELCSNLAFAMADIALALDSARLAKKGGCGS